MDSQGSVVVVGTRIPSEGLSGEVIKYDSTGNLLWDRRPSLGRETQFFGVTTDDSLNIYVPGTVTTQTAGDDVLLMKYSPDGDSLWVRTYDFGGDFEAIYSLTVAPDGKNIVGAGNTGDDGAWTFDLLAVKFTLDGETVWSRRMDIRAEDWGCGVAADTAGSVYVTGFAGS